MIILLGMDSIDTCQIEQPIDDEAIICNSLDFKFVGVSHVKLTPILGSEVACHQYFSV